MTSGTEFQIVNAIERAEEIRDPLIAETLGQKPRLLIEDCNPDRTVAACGTPSLRLTGFMTGAFQFVSPSTRYSEAPSRR